MSLYVYDPNILLHVSLIFTRHKAKGLDLDRDLHHHDHRQDDDHDHHTRHRGHDQCHHDHR